MFNITESDRKDAIRAENHKAGVASVISNKMTTAMMNCAIAVMSTTVVVSLITTVFDIAFFEQNYTWVAKIALYVAIAFASAGVACLIALAFYIIYLKTYYKINLTRQTYQDNADRFKSSVW